MIIIISLFKSICRNSFQFWEWENVVEAKIRSSITHFSNSKNMGNYLCSTWHESDTLDDHRFTGIYRNLAHLTRYSPPIAPLQNSYFRTTNSSSRLAISQNAGQKLYHPMCYFLKGQCQKFTNKSHFSNSTSLFWAIATYEIPIRAMIMNENGSTQ